MSFFDQLWLHIIRSVVTFFDQLRLHVIRSVACPSHINLRSGVLFSEERERKATRDSAVSQALVQTADFRIAIL